jgi:predicted Fe-S protein YdhL (DUF1289 family)
MVDAALTSSPVLSPCIGICRLDAQNLCVGCRRTLDEIAEWPLATESRRREIAFASQRRAPLKDSMR